MDSGIGESFLEIPMRRVTMELKTFILSMSMFLTMSA